MPKPYQYQTVVMEDRSCKGCGSAFRVMKRSESKHCSLVCRDHFPLTKKREKRQVKSSYHVTLPVEILPPGTLKGYSERQRHKLSHSGGEGAYVNKRNRKQRGL